MGMKKMVMAVALLIVSAMAAQSNAVPIKNVGGPGLAAPTVVIDFEGQAEGLLIDTQYAGVTFTQDDGGRPQIDNDPMLFGYGSTSGVGVLTGSTEGGAPFPTVAGLVAVFDSPVSQAGAYLSDSAPLGGYIVTAYADAARTLMLESLTILASEFPVLPTFPAPGSPGNGVFVGFSRASADIAAIQFGPGIAFGDAFAIDDLQWVEGGGIGIVPEPATATLALLGLGGLMMRRNRRSA